jgi:hypothetical protein
MIKEKKEKHTWDIKKFNYAITRVKLNRKRDFI